MQSSSSGSQQSATTAPPVLTSETRAPPREAATPAGGRWAQLPEWALVFVTGVLAVYTFKLWRSTSETAQRQLRAYVFMEEMEIHRPDGYVTLPDPPQIAPYRATYRNSGQTPAYDVQIEAGTFLEYPEVDTAHNWSLPVPADGNVSRGTIAPGAVIYQFYLDTLKPDQLQLLRDGTRRLFFAGSISYRDAFSKNRRTNFRLMREPGTHTFIACVKGNDSD
ncbi:MAG: hypothetical protein M3P12_10295 [Gemmatimonadota bacterium]|nr:hypothetical protein [Gemmatimonadota bacterium]